MKVNPFVLRALENYAAGHITIEELVELIVLGTLTGVARARARVVVVPAELLLAHA